MGRRKNQQDSLTKAAPKLLAACEALLEAAEIGVDDVFEGPDSEPVYDLDGSWLTLGLARQIQAAVKEAHGDAG